MGDLSRGRFTSWPRLVVVAWTLARADALVPREVDPLLSPDARMGARTLRLLAGRAAREGGPGRRLARALERLGPVAIKLGQFLSTRGDIFGQAFADDLARLKDQLPPFPTVLARAEVEMAIGGPLSALFVQFDEPVAAASLAQAHRARLTDGREVAVKVLRPDIERRVARDVDAMMLAARIVDAWPPARRLEPLAFAATVARALTLELDLRLEAAAADELREVMDDDGHMRAPRVVWDGVARRVLTLEWAEGVALSDPAALEQVGVDRARLADAMVRGFLAQALDHGVFHADLHEGNLFVVPPAGLAVVDFGIIGRLGPAERRYLAEILWGFLRRDYVKLADVHFQAGYVPAHHDRGAFSQALRAVGEPVFGRPAREVSMGRLLTQLFEITALFDMRLRPELVLLQKTMMTVEGVARRIDPDHDMWTAAEPVVRRWIARELSPAAAARAFAAEARTALAALARLAAERQTPAREQPTETRGGAGLAFALGALCAALAFALAVWLAGRA
ncbi:MAG TPA: 2-polyprenylphenol 6-hydroxylase [Caulobacteraceae bacterium]|jgi:ubiquinone biosynthesis protein